MSFLESVQGGQGLAAEVAGGEFSCTSLVWISATSRSAASHAGSGWPSAIRSWPEEMPIVSNPSARPARWPLHMANVMRRTRPQHRRSSILPIPLPAN